MKNHNEIYNLNDEKYIAVYQSIISSNKLNANEKILICHVLSWQNTGQQCKEPVRVTVAKLGISEGGFEKMITRLNKTTFFKSRKHSKENDEQTGSWYNCKSMTVNEHALQTFLNDTIIKKALVVKSTKKVKEFMTPLEIETKAITAPTAPDKKIDTPLPIDGIIPAEDVVKTYKRLIEEYPLDGTGLYKRLVRDKAMEYSKVYPSFTPVEMSVARKYMMNSINQAISKTPVLK